MALNWDGGEFLAGDLGASLVAVGVGTDREAVAAVVAEISSMIDR